MNIEIITYNSFNSELELIWRDFEHNSYYHAFQSYDWIYQWHTFIGSNKLKITPLIILVKVESKLSLILPLGIRNKNFIKIIECMGGDQSDYMSPLILKDFKMSELNYQKLWLSIIDHLPTYDVINLKKQPEKIFKYNNPFYKIGNKQELKSYSLNIENIEWENFYNQILKKKIRNDNTRQKKRLSEIGNLQYEILINRMDNTKYYKELIKNKSIQYHQTQAFDIFSVNEINNFYESLINKTKESIYIHFSILKLDNKVIASHLGLYNKNIFYYLIPAYNRSDFNKYSPGKILLENLIKWSIDNKLNIFDFTTGAEQYKLNWTDTEMNLSEINHISSLRGFLYSNIINLIARLKKIYKKNNIIKKIISPKNIIFRYFY